MASTIKLKNGTGVPLVGDLVQGEPAFDLTNKRLYTENASGAVIEVGTNPSTLSVTGAATFGGAVDIGGAISINGDETVGNDGVSSYWKATSGTHYFQTGGATKMTLDANGIVSIGTALAENSVGVYAFGTSAELRIKDGEENGTAQISIYNLNTTDDSEQFFVAMNGADVDIGNKRDALKLFAGGSERMRLDANGNVGLGITPTKLLMTSSAPNTVTASNGASFQISSPGLTVSQLNNTAIGFGTSGIVENYAGDMHLRSFWGVSIDKGAGVLESGAENSVSPDSRSFVIRQATSSTTWATQLVVDASGNLGLGITPSAWTGYQAMQFPYGGALAAYTGGAVPIVQLSSNTYHVSGVGDKYVMSAAAAKYQLNQGQHVWSTAPSGTADAVQSFTPHMTLDASGNLSIATGKLNIATTVTPASASSAGTTGDIVWDASYIYVCTATNTWKRTAIATW